MLLRLLAMSSMISKKLDAVQANAVWREAIEKEQKTIVLGDTFQISDARRCRCMDAINVAWEATFHVEVSCHLNT